MISESIPHHSTYRTVWEILNPKPYASNLGGLRASDLLTEGMQKLPISGSA